MKSLNFAISNTLINSKVIDTKQGIYYFVKYIERYEEQLQNNKKRKKKKLYF